MKNIISLLLAMLICSKAVCSDKKAFATNPAKTVNKIADTTIVKKPVPKIPAASTKDKSPKTKKETKDESSDMATPFSWRPVLIY
jgi:hypothetical protein